MKLAAYSTALLSTWLFLEEYGILFDAGDGVCAALGQKVGKIRHVFVTHADRDHLAGLIRLNELYPRPGALTIYYPRDCGSFPAIQTFCARFDPHVSPQKWIGLRDGDIVSVGNDLVVSVRVNDHTEVKPGVVKSLDFTLTRQHRKLLPELAGLKGAEIASLRATQGIDAVTSLREEHLLGFSGDTTALHPERWAGVKTLVHESTFLTPGTSRGRHASLPQVMSAASQLSFERLVLSHFSARYSHEQIRSAVASCAKANKITSPVHIILPGETAADLFADEPFWPGG